MGYFLDAEHYITTPANIPGNWQQNQVGVGNASGENGLVGDALNDLVWVPSSYEIETTHGQNIWQLEQSERAFANNGFANNSWLRTRASNNLDNARLLQADGTLAGGTPTGGGGGASLRPAIHIDVEAIYNSIRINSSFTNTSSADARMIIGSGNPVVSENTRISRNDDTKSITLNAGAGNSIEEITITIDGESRTIVPTTSFGHPETTQNWTTSNGYQVTIQSWYENSTTRQQVNMIVSNLSNHMNILVGATNIWNIEREFNWPIVLGYVQPSNPSDILVNGSYTNAVSNPTIEQIAPGHRFGGWWTHPTSGEEITSSTQVRNIANPEAIQENRLYARWLENQITITRVYNFDGALIGTPAVSSVTIGDTIVADPSGIPGRYPIGYNFAGWWTADGENGIWGEAVTAQRLITEAMNGTTMNIFARWETDNRVFVTLNLDHPGLLANGPILNSAWLVYGGITKI